MRTVLGVDLGTTGIRATVLNEEGTVVARIHHAYPPHASWTRSGTQAAEEDASFFYGALAACLSELISRSRVSPSEIAGIGISAMAPDAVAVDERGTALSPCILWMDRRAVSEASLIRRRLGEERVFRISGNPIDPYYGLCKVLWLKHNLPDIYRRAAKIVSLKDLLVGRLTGKYLTDFSHAGICGVAFDIRGNRWDQDVLDELGLDRGKLPELAPSDQVVGGVTTEAAQQLGLREGTPVANGMIDSAAGYLACGALEPLASAMTLGTSSCWGVGVEEPEFPPGMNITKTPWRPDLYLVNASLAGGGAALSWLLGLLGVGDSRAELAELQDKAARLPIGANRLVTLPHFLGERAPLWDPDARGLLFGLGPEHSREHLYRSAFEGIALSLYRNKLLLEEAGIHLNHRVVISGGSASSALFRRILADALDMSVAYIGEQRGGDYAAAWLAAKAVGITSDYTALQRKRGIVTETRPEADNHRRYRQLYDEVFSHLYSKLKRSYAKLAKYP